MPKTTGSNGSAKMPLRRSARQVAAAQPIVTVPQPVVPAKQDKKPVKKPTKRPATQAVDEAATKKRRTVANAVASQRNSSASPDDKLSSLPFDIFTLIMDEVKKLDATSLSKLGRTCRRFHSLLMPLVHKRVAVSAPYHAHIAHAIKTLQGHLSIGQNRQLKREGKYKGQRETFPRGLDEWLIPSSAQFVTQLISGIVDPGKKHRYIVIRYLEESLRNMRNIEIFESFDLTE
jgi:HAMP domain-containing protein